MFKEIMTKIVKQLAKWVLDYAGDAAVWAIKQANDRTLAWSYRDTLMTVVTRIGEDVALISASMKDGEISEMEADAIKDTINADAQKIKELL